MRRHVFMVMTCSWLLFAMDGVATIGPVDAGPLDESRSLASHGWLHPHHSSWTGGGPDGAYVAGLFMDPHASGTVYAALGGDSHLA